MFFNQSHFNGWKPKAYSEKTFGKKKKKYSHFQTITTNNSKHFFTFHIKQYWHFHWVTPKQYYKLFQTSNNIDTFREFLVNNTTRFSRVYMVSAQFILNEFAGLQSETSLINELLHSYFLRTFQLFRNSYFKEVDVCFNVLLLFSKIQRDYKGNMDTSSFDLIPFWFKAL